MIIDSAIEMEKQTRAYYEEAAGRVNDPSGKKMLELLAKEEKKHSQVLVEMRDGNYGNLAASSLIDEVRNLVTEGIGTGRNLISTDISLRGILQKAMEIEQAMLRFYEDKAAIADDAEVKNLFAKLAEQEKEHYLLISSLSEYFDRPAEWVESAEFGLRPEY